jgi:hypothetical protein
MEAKFVRGNRVWVIHCGIVTMTVDKAYVCGVQELKREVVYRLRLANGNMEYGRKTLAGDACVFATEQEACAEAYRRMLDDAERMRKRAGIKSQQAEPPRPAAAVAKSSTIRIPERFYTDHLERDLDAPDDIGEDKRYAIVRSDDPALPELLNDAEFYAHPNGPDAAPKGVTMSAKATVRAIRDVIGWDDAEPAILRLRKGGAQ